MVNGVLDRSRLEIAARVDFAGVRCERERTGPSMTDIGLQAALAGAR